MRTRRPTANPPLPVTVVTVGGSTAGIGETRYSGAIKADESVDVAFRLSGIVEEITQVRGADGRIRDLQDGDIVRRGEVLARLRQNEFQDQVSDADASLRQAQADYERASQLYENRSVSKAEYDAAYARYTAGRAKQSQAAISLSDATLRAPLNGVIIRRTVEVGSLAGPSAPAFTVADTRVVKVVFGVPDVVVAGLKPGGKLTDSSGGDAGRDARGSHRPDLAISRSQQPGVRGGGGASESRRPSQGRYAGDAPSGRGGSRHRLCTCRSRRSSGPAGDSTGYAVYVLHDSARKAAARLQPVRLGDVNGNLIAVRRGLTPGARVIVRGATIVADGQAVQVMP